MLRFYAVAPVVASVAPRRLSASANGGLGGITATGYAGCSAGPSAPASWADEQIPSLGYTRYRCDLRGHDLIVALFDDDGNGVVPVTVEAVTFEVDRGELGVGDFELGG
jgi:hypothetical protein